MKLARVEPLILNVSEKTNWFFIRVTLEDGVMGLGEASLNGWEGPQRAYTDELARSLAGKTVDEVIAALHVYPHSPGGLIASSVVSAIEQALTDARARQAGVPLHALLGEAQRNRIPVYANINRGARDRSPAGIAQAAVNAVAGGFRAVKIAPFDGVLPGDHAMAEGRARIRRGVERVLAMRDAVGPKIDIMVDCHWRFEETAALDVARDLAPARLYWLECPVSENPDGYAALARVRDRVHELGMKLAGAERQVGAAGFRPYVEGRLLDVVMPDVKYAGGCSEMLKIAALCERNGVAFSPHNPTGPVCNLVSMHVCAVAPAFLVLEHQLAESGLYYDVVRGFRPRLVDGCFEVPDTPGLGVELDENVLAAHPYRPLGANANLDPRLG
ncbi:MAG TPA: mandelate racemase/muconate lactonizing enzyme family protein [Burkholderiales bacterium]|nr:mandelate racemase/muconate lactonizing enzyme family protein [Burkholderiales bacterium]